MGGTGEDAAAKVDAKADDAKADAPDPAKADAAKPDATAQADAATPDAAQGDAATPDAATPDAAQPEPAAPPLSEFDALLVRVSELPTPRTTSEPSVEALNKGAWAHYKAGRNGEAAREFAKVAARDGAWKHAHNLACASAKAGRLDDVRVALAESFARGGEAAKASARKDGDLAEARKQAWFDALLTGPLAPAAIEDETPDGPPSDDEWDDADERPVAKGVPFWMACPSDTPDDDWCWFDVWGDFRYTELVFDKPIPLELDVPARPSKQAWTPAKGKISMKDIRAALGIQHTTDTWPASRLPELMFNDSGPFEDDGSDTKPFFWWPEPGTPILVMLQKQKLGAMRFVGVILARKTDAGWMATNLEVVSAAQDTAESNLVIESSIAMRSDGLELLTLSQQTCCEDDPPIMRRLCRVRFEEGRLAQACVTDDWRPVYD